MVKREGCWFDCVCVLLDKVAVLLLVSKDKASKDYEYPSMSSKDTHRRMDLEGYRRISFEVCEYLSKTV